jgi:lauroyl/myristoyl acyltransferase
MPRQMRARIRRYVKTALQGFLIFCFYPFLCLLPFGWGYKVARRLGDLNFRMMHQLRESILGELAECLPERTEEERREIARRAFQVQASFYCDSYMGLKHRIGTWTKEFVKIEGEEHVEASLKRGKGTILCSMHFNHYFLPLTILGRRFPTTGYGVWPSDLLKVDVFVKLHHWLLIKAGGRKFGAQFLAAGRHPKGALERVLGENRVLFILFDIPLPEMRDLRPVKFFGKEVLFPWGLVMVKYLTQAAFHIGYVVRGVTDWEKQTLIITPELTFSGKLAEDQQRVVTELEKTIRRYPEFWWGWGLISSMGPDFIREARRRGDYTTSILGKERE